MELYMFMRKIFVHFCSIIILLSLKGMDRTYQRENIGKHGFACKVVPEFSENTQKTFRGCLHRRGTKRFPVKAQSIVPTSHYFKVGFIFNAAIILYVTYCNHFLKRY